MNEKAGIFSKTHLKVSFCYKIRLSAGALHFGIAGGFQRLLTDFSKIRAQSPEEFASWNQIQSATVPDASVGFLYRLKKFSLGLSALQILTGNYSYRAPDLDKRISYGLSTQIIFLIQNQFPLKPNVLLYTPTLFVRSTYGLPFQFDLVNSFTFRNQFIFAVGYRSSLAVHFTVGLQISERLRILYSYEYGQQFQKVTLGSHELGLSFRLPKTNSNLKQPENIRKKTADEIFERLNEQEEEVQNLSRRTDSLDKNLKVISAEIREISSHQVTQGEAIIAVNETSSESSGSKRFKAIVNEVESTRLDTANSDFKIILGVYKGIDFAKKYQKILLRESAIETELFQLPDHPKKYIYVCEKKQFIKLQKALIELRAIRTNQSIDLSKAWILQR